jgi:hypothetical protein
MDDSSLRPGGWTAKARCERPGVLHTAEHVSHPHRLGFPGGNAHLGPRLVEAPRTAMGRRAQPIQPATDEVSHAVQRHGAHGVWEEAFGAPRTASTTMKGFPSLIRQIRSSRRGYWRWPCGRRRGLAQRCPLAAAERGGSRRGPATRGSAVRESREGECSARPPHCKSSRMIRRG